MRAPAQASIASPDTQDHDSGFTSSNIGSIDPPTREGRWTVLSPLEKSDLPFLYGLAIDERTGFRWRHAGAVPPFDVFCQNVWNGVALQFIVREKKGHQPIGLVQLYNVDHLQQFGYFAAAFIQETHGVGIAAEGIANFISYVFATWNLRKLYMDMPEYNVSQISGVIQRGPLALEGRFTEHSYYQGRWWDRFIFAIHRQKFIEWMGSGGMGGHTNRKVGRD